MGKNYSFRYVWGAKFNEEMAGIKLCKVLDPSMTHNGYKYEPNALNDLTKLGEQFNPDPNCLPGGLYFCAEPDVLLWIDSTIFRYQLVAPVEIPEDAMVSIAKHKFKTNKLILGEPVTVEAFCSGNKNLNLSVNFLNGLVGSNDRDELYWFEAKNAYALLPNIFDTKLKANLLYSAMINCDTKFFLSKIEDMQKMQEWDQIKKELVELLGTVPTVPSSAAGRAITWFRTQIPQYAMLFVRYDASAGRCNDLDRRRFEPF